MSSKYYSTLWLHAKSGKIYKSVALAFDVGTQKPVVLYEPLAEKSIPSDAWYFSRDEEDFNRIDPETNKPRFQRMDQLDPTTLSIPTKSWLSSVPIVGFLAGRRRTLF